MKSTIQYGAMFALVLSLVACGGDDSLSETEAAQDVQTIQMEEKSLESVGVQFQAEVENQNGTPKRTYRMHRRYTNRSWSNEQIARALDHFVKKLQHYLTKHRRDEDSRAKLECAVNELRRMR